jgi:hypothetical protein
LKQLNRFARIFLKIRAAKQLQGELASAVATKEANDAVAVRRPASRDNGCRSEEAGRDKQLFQGENAVPLTLYLSLPLAYTPDGRELSSRRQSGRRADATSCVRPAPASGSQAPDAVASGLAFSSGK